jgi:hypothetical protein
MKIKAYKVLEMCVEEGVAYGYMRAHKHTDNPSDDEVTQAIINAVMGQIWEWFDLGENNESAL